MGVVYRAWQVGLGRMVALKMIARGGSGARFRREARLIARINSPHVVAVHDLHTLPDDRLILVMEYVEGTDLARMLKARGGPLPEAQVLPWMQQVADGMRAAADQRIIHRDVKPSNILIDIHERARVVDFGLGRGPTEFGELTHSHDVVGTPYYMAPEQAEDPQSVDTRADIYSFGATFYHALTGAPPFEGKTAFAILYKHKTEPLVSPMFRNTDISRGMSDLLERCLAKSPGDRFPSFAELSAQLRPASGPRSSWEMPEDPAWARYHEAYKDRRASSLYGPPESGECDVYQFPQGRVLRIIRGDLAEQQVDALVNSVANDLPLGHGVARALLRAGGDGIAREAARFAMVRPGRVVVTSAGIAAGPVRLPRRDPGAPRRRLDRPQPRPDRRDHGELLLSRRHAQRAVDRLPPAGHRRRRVLARGLPRHDVPLSRPDVPLGPDLRPGGADRGLSDGVELRPPCFRCIKA
jgi:hypothetical protein